MKHRNLPVKKSGHGGKIIALLVILVFVFSCITLHRKEIRKKEAQTAVENIGNLITLDAQRSQSVDNWWMRTSLPATLETQALLNYRRDQVVTMLQKYRGISAETESLVTRFSKFNVGAFVDGTLRLLWENGVVPFVTPDAIAIYFVPEDAARKSLIYNPMWSSDHNGVIITALDIPEKLQVAILFHELGHAKRHNKTDGMKDSDVGSDERFREEVEMHQFGADILNSLSQGAYYKRIDEIIARKPREKRFEQVIASVTVEDARAFNAMFDCTGEAPSKILAAGYAFIIGFRFCEARDQGMKEKIGVYRWFEANLH